MFEVNGSKFDSATDAVAFLMEDPNYVRLEDEQATLRRIDFAFEVADAMQDEFVIASGGVADENQLEVLAANKFAHLHVGDWACQCPLVLVTTMYAPYSSVAAPTGNLVWIDPSDEYVMLTTLGAAETSLFAVDVQN